MTRMERVSADQTRAKLPAPPPRWSILPKTEWPWRAGLSDPEQLEFAASQGRVICTGNVGDFFQLHTEYLTNGLSHAGIVIIQRQGFSIREQIRRLLRLIKTKTAESMQNNLEFLSYW